MNGIVTIGTALATLGYVEQGREAYQYMIALARDIGHDFHLAKGLWALGFQRGMAGDFADGRRLLVEGLAIFQNLDDRFQQGYALVLLGQVEYRAGNGSQARQYLVEALQIGIELRVAPVLSLGVRLAGYLLASQGQPGRALSLLALYSAFWFRPRGVSNDGIKRRDPDTIVALPANVANAAWERGQKLNLWDTALELLAEFSADDSPK